MRSRYVFITIKKDAKLSFKLNSLVKEKLEEEAKKEGVTLSSFVNNIVVKELKERNIKITIQESIDLI